MRSIAARNGDQFMVFQIAPDGQIAVSGAVTELTAAQLSTAAASGNVTPLPRQHGLDAGATHEIRSRFDAGIIG